VVVVAGLGLALVAWLVVRSRRRRTGDQA
jgi:hypothetical protein